MNERATGDGSMTKELKTAQELAQMIRERAPNLGHIQVSSDPAYGWHVAVFSTPSEALEHRKIAEQIAEELRLKYDLKP
jgi:hypothetical protein